MGRSLGRETCKPVNNLTQAIKERISKKVFFEVRSYFRMRKLAQYPFSEDPLKYILSKYKKECIKAYFFSNHFAKKQEVYNELYKYFNDVFTSSLSEGLFDFNGLIVPKPKEESSKYALIQELLDFLGYYIDGDIEFWDAVSIEGPYEYGDVRVSVGDIVIDCGANMGLFSAAASYKGANVYAFEPFEVIIDRYLTKTAENNKNISICKHALSNEEKQTEFIHNSNYITIGGLTDFAIPTTLSWGEKETVTVQAIPLDTWVEKNNIPRVDFIKADIEGAERYMLMGAKKVLKEFAPKIAICTYHLPDDSKVFREIILDANPNYIIEERFLKMYAYV